MAELALTKDQFYYHMKKGNLPKHCRMIGRGKRWARSDVEAFKRDQAAKAKRGRPIKPLTPAV